MRPLTGAASWWQLVVAGAIASACADAPTRVLQPTTPQLDAVKFWEDNATTRWNRRATDLLGTTTLPNAQAAASRILTYLSIAQHRAALAAEAGKDGSKHPSVSAAIAAASVVVLSQFYPLSATTLEQQFDADLAAPGWPGRKNQDSASGETIGRAVGASVLAQAATDNYLVVAPPTQPPGPGRWVPLPNPVRSLFGVRPFFLTSADQIRPGPPPAFGSAEYLAALAEIRTISDTRTAEQVSIAQAWANQTAPFTAGAENLIADEIIAQHHRDEKDAARILAYANAAAFDAQIACWEAKAFYYFIRPTQADPAITLAVPLPNHPSYPSGHSCITGAIMSVLMDAFPSERGRLEEIIEIAGLSRMYGGLHYRFDIDAGATIGRQAAALALAGSLE
ncbi:MAG TPA: vanadium-dependent haloperoxidase [Gemmatimonadaceae bacterium]|nr:vanadium-dependent haloperoxidase [Gemmatimonadaceae bacterium]